MLKQCFFMSALIFCALQAAPADTIQLKEKSAIVGKILSEKRDQVVVDVGYTVLVIPRNQIAKISKAGDDPPPSKGPMRPAGSAPPLDPAEGKAGFYSAPSQRAPARNVRDLVNLLGEAV